MKDSNTSWADSGEGSCPSSLLPSGAPHQKQSRLIRHQATTKVASVISAPLSDEHRWFCSHLKDAIGNLWDLPLASSLLANFARRLRNCNSKDPNTPAAPKGSLPSENSGETPTLYYKR